MTHVFCFFTAFALGEVFLVAAGEDLEIFVRAILWEGIEGVCCCCSPPSPTKVSRRVSGLCAPRMAFDKNLTLFSTSKPLL